jgi:hypothetical protein
LQLCHFYDYSHFHDYMTLRDYNHIKKYYVCHWPCLTNFWKLKNLDGGFIFANWKPSFTLKNNNALILYIFFWMRSVCCKVKSTKMNLAWIQWYNVHDNIYIYITKYYINFYNILFFVKLVIIYAKACLKFSFFPMLWFWKFGKFSHILGFKKITHRKWKCWICSNFIWTTLWIFIQKTLNLGLLCKCLFRWISSLNLLTLNDDI